MTAAIGDLVFVGIHGHIVAVSRDNGGIAWSTALKGSGFVNVVVDGDRLLAITRGELFCVEPESGTIRWSNPLRGLGLELATLATAHAPSNGIPTEIRQQFDDAAAAASGVMAAG